MEGGRGRGEGRGGEGEGRERGKGRGTIDQLLVSKYENVSFGADSISQYENQTYVHTYASHNYVYQYLCRSTHLFHFPLASTPKGQLPRA